MENIHVVKKLIGPIGSVGDSRIDNERFENLKNMCSLVKELLYEIDNKSCGWPFAKEHSIRRNCDYGIKFLEEIGFRS